MAISPSTLRAKNNTRADLAEAVYNQLGLSRTESAELVEMVLQEITAVLEKGEPVKLTKFGVFSVRSKRERVGRNPKNGVEAPIPARRVLTFKPSRILKSKVNGTIVCVP